MKCLYCKKESIALFEGGLCRSCYVNPDITDLPVTEKRSFTTDINAIREQARNQKNGAKKVQLIKKRDRQYYPPKRISYVIEFEGQYKQWKNCGGWGELLTAKMYNSLPRANMAIKVIGKGTAVKL